LKNLEDEFAKKKANLHNEDIDDLEDVELAELMDIDF